MRRLFAFLVATAIASSAIAAPSGVPADDIDDTATLPAPIVEATPPPLPPEPSRNTKLLALGGLTLTYAAFSTYAYFAWFRGKENNGVGVTFEGFGVDTYAGGVDKIGHLWTGYLVSRATTSFLTAAGYRKWPASLIAAGISQVFFTLSEYEDSLVYQFELSDIIANVAGAGLAVLFVNAPAVDRLLDFRLEYFPSSDYRRTVREDGNIDFFQDYSGQSYMFALHLDAIPRMPGPLGYLDVVGGFETRNYSPPRADPTTRPKQTLYLGVSINMQHVLRSLFCDCTGRRVGETVFEYVSLPYTTLKALPASRTQ